MGYHGYDDNGRKIVKQVLGRTTSIPTMIQKGNAMILPNHSGDHSAGIVNTTPTADADIANKKYVDDSSSSHTESSTDSLTNKTIDSFTNDVHADHLHEELRNESGGPMAVGDAVFISGYNVGQERALAELADASNASTMPCIAILEDTTLANNATGEFIESGTVTDMDTNSWNVGDELYISETGTTGNTLTTTKPTGSALIQKVAIVLRKHATLGIIEVFGAGRTNDVPNSFSALGITLTGDNSSEDVAYVPMIVYDDDDTLPAASNYPVGTLGIVYTP